MYDVIVPTENPESLTRPNGSQELLYIYTGMYSSKVESVNDFPDTLEYTTADWGTSNVWYFKRSYSYASTVNAAVCIETVQDILKDKLKVTYTRSALTHHIQDVIWMLESLDIGRQNIENLLKYIPICKFGDGKLLKYYDYKSGKAIETRPGRWLRKAFPEANDVTVESFSSLWDAKFGDRRIDVFTEGKDIAKAYLEPKNVGSCMSYKTHKYLTDGIHPTEAYGSDDETKTDLQLLVVYKKGHEGEFDQISGRVLVWPEKKIRSSIYGESFYLSNYLELEGYKCDSFTGARIRAIELEDHPGVFVCPYIDGSSYVYHDKVNKQFILDGRKLEIDITGMRSYECQNTCGSTGRVEWCDDCDQWHFTDDHYCSYDDYEDDDGYY